MSRIKITNGSVNKFIQEEDLNIWVEQGWYKGWYNQEEQNIKNSIGNKKRWQVFKQEDNIENQKNFSEKISTTLKKYHQELSPEEKEKKNQKRLTTRENWSQEEKELYCQRMSQSAKKHRASAPPEYWENTLKKSFETKRKNHTFNTSKPEEKMYQELCKQYGEEDVFRNYRDDERYPFACDFYIKSLDKFIELNACWTHGGRPFDENDPSCLEQLHKWEKKAEQSEFYRNTIHTWTVSDVRKIETTRINNLNYEAIYDYN